MKTRYLNYRFIVIIAFCFISFACSGGSGNETSNEPAEETIFPTNEVNVPSVSSKATIQDYEGYELEVADRQLTIEFNDSATTDDYNVLIGHIENNGCFAIGQIPCANTLIINIPSNDKINTLIEDLKAFSFVGDVYPNMIVESLSLLPDLEHFEGDGWIEQIHAMDAWQYVKSSIGTVGSPSIMIGILDAGKVAVDSGHFSGKDILGLGNQSGEDTQRDTDHATAVAALAAASGENGSGMTGVAWNCPLRFYDAVYGPEFLTSNHIKKGMIKLIEAGSKVVNISLGKNHEADSASIANEQQRFRYEIKKIAKLADEADQKPLIVLAQGNQEPSQDGGGRFADDNALFPTNSKNANYWEALWKNYVIIVSDAYVGINTLGPHIKGAVTDIAAPSEGTSMALADGSVVNSYPGDSGTPKSTSGTSFAAPLVTGAAALMFSLNPDLPPWEVKQILVGTAQKSDCEIGILDLYAAVTQVALGGANYLLKGDYIVSQFMDDEVNTGGYLLTTRTQLTFHGDGTGTYAELSTSTGSTASGSISYTVGTEGQVTVVNNNQTLTGRVSSGGDIFMLCDADSSDDAIAMMIGVKQSSNMSNVKLNGEYVGSKFREKPDTVSTSRNGVTFYGNGNGAYQVLSDSREITYGDAFLYTVAADGTYDDDGGIGIVNSDGQLVVAADTQNDGDIALQVVIKKGTALSNALLEGHYTMAFFGKDHIGTPSEVSFTCTMAYAFDGNGNGTETMVSHSQPEHLQDIGTTNNITYTVSSDGSLSINGYIGQNGIIQSDGEILLIVDTDNSDNELSFGFGIKQ